jgi:probable HAF family extracellular repeat protein
MAVFGLAVLVMLAATPRSAWAQTYTVTDLGILGSTSNNNFSEAFCINAGGEIGGQSSSSSPTEPIPAFLYIGGSLTNLGTLGGEYAQASGINASGQLAGYSTLSDGSYRAFLYSGGQMIDLGTLGEDYSAGYAINDSGSVAGDSMNGSGQSHAFLYSGGQMADLGTLGGDSSSARGINSHGVVVGYSYNAAGDFLGFTYQQGKMTAIGTLGGTWSIAYAINDIGQITGQGYTAGNLLAHAFLLRNGTMTDLGMLEKFGNSWGLSINKTGAVVGYATFGGTYHAFISTGGKKMQDLNHMIGSGTGWVLVEADSINAAGQIVGFGTLHGQTRAFLLNRVK